MTMTTATATATTNYYYNYYYRREETAKRGEQGRECKKEAGTAKREGEGGRDSKVGFLIPKVVAFG